MKQKAAQKAAHRPLPPALAEVRLIDAATAASVGGVSESWWFAAVRAGSAPAPAVRLPRCTRWRVADVAEFWARFAAEASAGNETAEQACKASAAARAKRSAKLNEAAAA